MERASKSLADKLIRIYLRFYLNRMFAPGVDLPADSLAPVEPPAPDPAQVKRAADALMQARHPLILVGSQAMLDPQHIEPLIAALGRIGAPVYLSGMARGLLGREHALQMRHKRREAMREADFVFLAGVPADFRLDYGHHIPRRATLVSANRSREMLNLNRKPTIGIQGDPSLALEEMARLLPESGGERWTEWLSQLHERETAQVSGMAEKAHEPVAAVNPVYLCQQLDEALSPKAILIGDGGDFVATAASLIRPPGPLRWLDPGAFGTLGIGAGFAIGAKLVHPDAEVWVLFGDGAVGYSLGEFDSLVRHKLPVIAVVGNDAGWTQVGRGQVEVFGDDVATTLSFTDYHRVAEGFGAAGLRIDDPELVPDAIVQARSLASAGSPVLVNVILGKSDFRKGAISI
jgi:acetolactate synthase-1/2/3 large subunit